MVNRVLISVIIAGFFIFPAQAAGQHREEYQPQAERLKRTPPRSMGGHNSVPGTISRQALASSPKRCLAEVKKYLYVLNDITNWFKPVIYGSHSKRVLTGQAASRVRDMLFGYITSEIDIGKRKFAAAKRGEDASGLCVNHIIAAKRETLRVFNIVKTEAAAGNRDLEGTGLNPMASVYNK